MTLTDAAWVRRHLATGLRPEPPIPVSAWAERHRVLPPASAEPGRWRNARTPYLTEIMDQLSAVNPTQRVVVMKGAQLGFTEAGNNWIGYVIHNAPGIMLNVMPSLDDVKRNSAVRIDPLIEHCPALRERVTAPKSRDPGNSMFRKKFPGGELIMTGGTSPKGLRSTPVRYLFCDEIDGYPTDAGDEGDPIALAEQRTVTFKGRRKIYLVSTPTIKGRSRIERAFMASDQRRYFVPCLHCESWAAIEWDQIKYSPDAPTGAEWACPTCGGLHSDADKPVLLARGEWRPTAISSDGTIGYHLSGLYSPFESWGDVALVFEQSKNDPVALKSWTNTKLGLPFDEDSDLESFDPASLTGRGEDFGGMVPADAVVLVAGVDNQPDRLEVSVIAFGAHEESWVLEHRIIWGDITGPEPWRDLDLFLARRFPHARDIPDLPIAAACVDTGGSATLSVYQYLRGRAKKRIWGTKGKSVNTGPFWPKAPSKSNKGKIPLYSVNAFAGKDVIHGRLRKTTPGPGYIHLSRDLPETYVAGLTAEKPRTVYKRGRPVREWILPAHARNEPFDCAVLALAALHGLYSQGLNLDAAAAAIRATPMRSRPPAPPAPAPMLKKPVPQAPAAPAKPAVIRPRRSSYLG